MKKLLLQRLSIVAFAVAASSCAYDPYYSSSSVSYSSGYGDGYGYGGSGFSTTYFVSTGDPRWGYDPYCHSYYDYRSRRYYDPYLYGYYPMGYRPVAVVGVPHPYGWRHGSRHCPPPRTVRNVTVVNYRDREGAYRRSNYSWADKVRRHDGGDYRTRNHRSGSTDSFRRTHTERRDETRTRYNSGQFADTRESSGFLGRQQDRTKDQNRGTDFRRTDRRSRELQINPSRPPVAPEKPRESRRDTESVMRHQRPTRDSSVFRPERETRPQREFRHERSPQMERERRQSEPTRSRDEPREESNSSRDGNRKLRSLGEG